VIQLKKIPLIIVVGISFLMVPAAMLNQDFLHAQMDKVLNLKIRQAYKGGEKLYRFADPLGDDYGAGEITYPRNPHFKNNGVLDLLSFTIHKPQTEEDWSEDNIYWQFSYKIKEMSDSLVINHYLGFRNYTSPGRVDTLLSRAELIQFDKDYPWHYQLNINTNNKTATIISADEKYKQDITLMLDLENSTVFVRVPLNYKPLRYILIEPGSYHYIVTGGFDSLATNNFIPIKKRSSLRSGGGAVSSITPRVYDYLSPDIYSQKDVLNSYNEVEYSFATLKPVLAFSELKKEKSYEISEGDLKNVIRDLKSKIKSDLIAVSEIDRAIELFNNNENLKSEIILKSILVDDPENSIALAYLGSVTAIKGGETNSISESMKLVYDSFNIYDDAMLRIKSLDEELAVRLNRGNVALSVPESVFQKCQQGAKDFLRAADIYKELYPESIVLPIVILKLVYVLKSLVKKKIA